TPMDWEGPGPTGIDFKRLENSERTNDPPHTQDALARGVGARALALLTDQTLCLDRLVADFGLPRTLEAVRAVLADPPERIRSPEALLRSRIRGMANIPEPPLLPIIRDLEQAIADA